jgi:hypothetical protein
MARNNLTSKKRAFRQNPKTFLNKITEAPVSITINDGVNPPYTVSYNTNAGTVDLSDAPPGVTVEVERDTFDVPQHEL